MAWAKLDDQFNNHPKTREAWRTDPVSVGLYALALSWAAQYETDGRVTPAWVEDQLPDEEQRTSAVSALVNAGLWVENGNGWVIHDYLEYNPSKAEIQAKREADKQRKARARK